MTPRRSCILVELTDGSLRAFDYPDEETAEVWYRECRDEWNAERNVTFHLPSRLGRPSSMAVYDADDVAHLEVTTRDNAVARGAECFVAVTYG